MSFLPKQQLEQLKAFIGVLKAKPDVIHDPALAFLKDYLVTSFDDPWIHWYLKYDPEIVFKSSFYYPYFAHITYDFRDPDLTWQCLPGIRVFCYPEPDNENLV